MKIVKIAFIVWQKTHLVNAQNVEAALGDRLKCCGKWRPNRDW